MGHLFLDNGINFCFAEFFKKHFFHTQVKYYKIFFNCKSPEGDMKKGYIVGYCFFSSFLNFRYLFRWSFSRDSSQSSMPAITVIASLIAV